MYVTNLNLVDLINCCKKLLLVFIMVSISGVKGLRSEEICELLEYEGASEFSDFIERESFQFWDSPQIIFMGEY